MRNPVSLELRDSRITSTRGADGGAAFNFNNFCTSGNAMPGASSSFSRDIW
jgi:hypothetical protein